MINNLSLQNFRNWESKTLIFNNSVNVIVGPNASGKTNILESIFLLATGKSFKGANDEDLINKNANFGRIKALSENTKLEILIRNNSRKKLLVNGVPKRLIDFTGNLKVVLFAPQDLDLVTSSPSLRRRFLDNVLSQTNREYHRSALSYEKGLRARNKLLARIRDEGVPRNQLLFWDQLLIKNGDYLTNCREEFINFINQTPTLNKEIFSLTYDKSIISPARLDQYKNAEIASATTLVGPHRDDFTFNQKSRDLSRFGSRGEQRMAVLWLKLAELSFIGNSPTLLLDDIFSELDISHREIVMKIANSQQTIITTAELINLPVDTKLIQI